MQVLVSLFTGQSNIEKPNEWIFLESPKKKAEWNCVLTVRAQSKHCGAQNKMPAYTTVCGIGLDSNETQRNGNRLFHAMIHSTQTVAHMHRTRIKNRREMQTAGLQMETNYYSSSFGFLFQFFFCFAFLSAALSNTTCERNNSTAMT